MLVPHKANTYYIRQDSWDIWKEEPDQYSWHGSVLACSIPLWGLELVPPAWGRCSPVLESRAEFWPTLPIRWALCVYCLTWLPSHYGSDLLRYMFSDSKALRLMRSQQEHESQQSKGKPRPPLHGWTGHYTWRQTFSCNCFHKCEIINCSPHPGQGWGEFPLRGHLPRSEECISSVILVEVVILASGE